ncbi:hypothetical protein [Rhizobium sp. CAU 1783]
MTAAEREELRRKVAESPRPFVAAGEVIGAMVAVMEAIGGPIVTAEFLARMHDHVLAPQGPDHSLTEI